MTGHVFESYLNQISKRAMYLNCIWIKNGSEFVFELEICICIEIGKKSNVFVFDLAELYLYLIPKCVFGPNPAIGLAEESDMMMKASCVLLNSA